MQWTITLPEWHPPSMNQYVRTHWAVRKRDLDNLTNEIHLISTYQRIPKATTPRAVRIVIQKTPRGKRDDPGNLYARSKAILDALVRCELLLDDDNTSLEALEVVERRADTKQTLIEITEGGADATEDRSDS